jgi:hypothetical protein
MIPSRMIGVSTIPGQSATTLIPRNRSSASSVSLFPTTPNFEAQYGANLAPG